MAEVVLVVISIVWGSTFWLIKDVLHRVPTDVLVSYRFFIAAIIFLPWSLRYREHFRRCLLPGICLGGVLWALYTTQTWGLNFTTAANSGFITGLFLLFVPLLQFLFRGIWVTKAQAVSIGIAAPGLWLLTGGVHGINRGDGFTLVSALLIAGQILLVDRFSRDLLNFPVLNFIQFSVVGVLSLLGAFSFKEAFMINGFYEWGVILYLSLFATVLCFLGQLWGQRYVSAIKATLIFLLEPVSAAVFAWTLGGEGFTFQTILGGGLILLAIGYSQTHDVISKMKKKRDAKNQ